jgi:capsular polysaccharide biosynthesis protein
MMAAVSRATARSAPSSISVIADATPPSKASWPNAKLLVLLAIVAGSIAGIVLALIIDLLFGRVHRYRLRDIGGDLPVYAMLRRDAAYAAELFALPTPSDQTGWRLLQNDRH